MNYVSLLMIAGGAMAAAFAGTGCAEQSSPSEPPDVTLIDSTSYKPSGDLPSRFRKPIPRAERMELDEAPAENMLEKVVKTDDEWRRLLTPEQYRVTRQGGTELRGTGKYLHTKVDGAFNCVCCGAELFTSSEKYDSGCGWPAFYAPADASIIRELEDNSFGMQRVEIRCAKCDAHLGHVFNDGPAPTGLRYCVNSVALELDPDESEARSGGAEADDAAASARQPPSAG